MAFTLSSLTSIDVFLAFCGGLLPALLWLWFWLKEDPHPEPRRVLILTFLAGMMMAVVALFLEQIALFTINSLLAPISTAFASTLLLIVWASIEEITKYIAAKKAFRLPYFDEPIDAVVYLITAALGFAALENILFLLKIFGTQNMLVGFITGNLRFLGATLLHVTASAVIGASIAFSFFHKEKLKRNVLGGLILAVVLHTLFNYFIIKGGETNFFKILISLWGAIIILILIFEKIRGLDKINH